MYFIPVIKAEFSASLRQSSVSHDPSEIILICWSAAQETLLNSITAHNWDHTIGIGHFKFQLDGGFLSKWVSLGLKKNSKRRS